MKFKIPKQVYQLEKLVGDNSPLILTVFGVAGVATTAVLASKATLKADAVLNNEDTDPHYVRTKRETFELVWKLYIPAVLSGTLTCGAIIAANRIGTRRTAAMAAGLAITERAYDEYREKVVEEIGKNKEAKVRDAVHQDRVNKDIEQGKIVFGDDDHLCKDAWSGRYFKSNMEEIKAAQNHVNYQINNGHGGASLSELYNWLGLEPTKESDNVGWNSDELLEISFSTVLNNKNKPVLVMDFPVQPIRKFWKAHR